MEAACAVHKTCAVLQEAACRAVLFGCIFRKSRCFLVVPGHLPVFPLVFSGPCRELCLSPGGTFLRVLHMASICGSILTWRALTAGIGTRGGVGGSVVGNTSGVNPLGTSTLQESLPTKE
ncbi:hypothetical protein NDU88_002198 [Pleurodeles waltl]|uniref:Uncharacterized protein n=1 Tax=Pleurodeles waltl TaxID=8319 RepID=A0AAV7MNP5_PLEWA|nr:hypothetical protein NDU88_002198 [Pleurodeles waltl]